MTRAARGPKRATRYELTEVLLDEQRGARAVLRPLRGNAEARTLTVPLGAVDATMLSLALHGLPAVDRPSWHRLYTTTLRAAGVTVDRVELDAVSTGRGARGEHPSGCLIGAIAIVTPAGTGTRVAAPVEAALLVAIEAGAPLYVTAPAYALASATAAKDREPAGAALLATLLASLPDEDFGPVH
jgi:hypothetical protein